MDRRTLVCALTGGLLAPPFIAWAQPAGKVPRIGVLTSNPMTEELQESFRQGLRDHAYIEGKNISVEWRAAIEGKNISVEWRAAGGRSDLAKALAGELVRSKVDVIVAIFTPAVQAAKDATSTIPIVMAPAGAPVATGLVASLARPVEQPTKFEMVINLKTAKALGLTVPSSLVAGADQVIE